MNCHCRECWRFQGHYAAYTKVSLENMYLVGSENMSWHQMCRWSDKKGLVCATRVKFVLAEVKTVRRIGVAAGSFAVPTKVSTGKNI